MSVTTTTDRRRFLRIQFDGTTELSVSTGHWPVELVDLSMKGALIRCDTSIDWPDEAPGLLRISLANQQTILSFESVLVRQQGDHYGLRFERIDLDTMTHLRRLVELNLGSENLLERELEQLFPVAQPTP